MKKNFVEDASSIKESINEFKELEHKKAPKHKSTTEKTRFNIYLSVSQLDKIKLIALKEHRKIKDVIEEALSLYLEEK